MDGATVFGLRSTVCFTGMVARVESMRQVEGLFESMLAEAFEA